MVALLSKQISNVSFRNVASERLPRKCCLEYDLKTLWLSLRRPNIALVILCPFRIYPYNSNDGATYSLIVGWRCLNTTKKTIFGSASTKALLRESAFVAFKKNSLKKSAFIGFPTKALFRKRFHRYLKYLTYESAFEKRSYRWPYKSAFEKRSERGTYESAF